MAMNVSLEDEGEEGDLTCQRNAIKNNKIICWDKFSINPTWITLQFLFKKILFFI